MYILWQTTLIALLKKSLCTVVITISFQNENLSILQNKLYEQCFESDALLRQKNVGHACQGKKKLFYQ